MAAEPVIYVKRIHAGGGWGPDPGGFLRNTGTDHHRKAIGPPKAFQLFLERGRLTAIC